MTVPTTPTVTLAALAETAPGARLIGEDLAVGDVAYDSRSIMPGTLFFCVPGAHVDGHEFARDAIASGAVALVVERSLEVAVPQILVPSVRASMAPIATAFFGEPSRALTLVGVTGTNGKTTSTFMMESVFRATGARAGLIGNIERHIDDEILPAQRNTPEAIDLQRLLARMRDAGVTGAAMEVSSEGLLFSRVEGTRFACGVFTNLTQDHLNTHGTMEAYFEAKMMLFRPEMSERAVVNTDDAYGRILAERSRIPLTTFAVHRDADVRGIELEVGARSSRLVAQVAGRRVPMEVPLPAAYNVSNALGVLAASVALGLPLDDAARGIAALKGVPGRVESIDAGQDFTVLVDYAHTPDALHNVLVATREITPPGARLVVVFGCGGDRDQTKRPQMGKVAAALADRCIITSDNPRTEDPDSIIAMIEQGAASTGRAFESIVDRRDAIATAVADAKTGDVIVIAGKGHESGQQFADHTIPFDDRHVAREILEGRA